MSAATARFHISPTRWPTVPLPDEAKVSCFFFAASTSAFTDSNGALAETTSTSGTVPTSATGVTSLAGSNGSFL